MSGQSDYTDKSRKVEPTMKGKIEHVDRNAMENADLKISKFDGDHSPARTTTGSTVV